jgi:radical SAM protein with 4Fe4S-binding SPASM domain
MASLIRFLLRNPRIESFLYQTYFTFSRMFSYVEIETITTCNRRCLYCPNSIYDRGLKENQRLMPVSLYHKIIDDLRELNFSGYIHPHFYGEPCIDSRLPDLLRFTRRTLPKAKIELSTNGDLLTLSLYQQLVNSGVSSFFVTNHSCNLQQNIQDVLAYRTANNISTPAFVYGTLANKLLSNRGGNVPLNTTVSRRSLCMLPSRYLTIDVEGNVLLCCNDYHGTVCFGNLNSLSISEIWNDKKFRDARKKILHGNLFYKICQNCTNGMMSIK